MNFFESVMHFLQDLFLSIFASSSPEYAKKHQLREIATQLKTAEPPIYRADGYLLPAFPAAFHQIYAFLKPVRELLETTIAGTDKRTSERYREFIIELTMPAEQRELRHKLTFAARSEDIAIRGIPPERAIEDHGKIFTQFVKQLDSAQMKKAVRLLQKITALADFCQFDFNGLFASFDPAFRSHEGRDSTVEHPSFSQVEVAEIVPALLDLYYLLTNLELDQSVFETIAIIEAKKNNAPLTDDLRGKTNRLFQAVLFILQKRVGRDHLLSIIRLAKEDPTFVPEKPVFTEDYVQEYRQHIADLFDSDSRKLLKDKQANEMQKLITAAFGSKELEQIEGYNETTSAMLQQFTTLSLEWILPLQILKTFAKHWFDPHYRQVLRSVIVEGYFTNRAIQSSISSAFYFCEAMVAKISEFESLFQDHEPCSLAILTGYITELEKGIDFEKPLRKMVENMNAHAKNLVQQAVNSYTEVLSFSLVILDDNKKPVPDWITNIRVLTASAKNIESFVYLEKEIGVFRNFLELMKKYAIVGTISASSGIAIQPENR